MDIASRTDRAISVAEPISPTVDTHIATHPTEWPMRMTRWSRRRVSTKCEIPFAASMVAVKLMFSNRDRYKHVNVVRTNAIREMFQCFLIGNCRITVVRRVERPCLPYRNGDRRLFRGSLRDFTGNKKGFEDRFPSFLIYKRW